ncbi:hypothetical protein [Lactobacillus terrae]|uniref:hypothetical protein n=1 Tax=Lactobacillus terrae TaxID=2269374 RepID=UPI0015D080B0|nr:hypothetical protein [Lactobacillus terrae]
MKAVVISEPGDSNVLKIVDRPIPTADNENSVIKIHAFGIHGYEALTREGLSPDVVFPRVIVVEITAVLAIDIATVAAVIIVIILLFLIMWFPLSYI